MKQSSWARWWRDVASGMRVGSVITARGRRTTLVNSPEPSGCSAMVPLRGVLVFGYYDAGVGA